MGHGLLQGRRYSMDPDQLRGRLSAPAAARAVRTPAARTDQGCVGLTKPDTMAACSCGEPQVLLSAVPTAISFGRYFGLDGPNRGSNSRRAPAPMARSRGRGFDEALGGP